MTHLTRITGAGKSRCHMHSRFHQQIAIQHKLLGLAVHFHLLCQQIMDEAVRLYMNGSHCIYKTAKLLYIILHFSIFESILFLRIEAQGMINLRLGIRPGEKLKEKSHRLPPVRRDHGPFRYISGNRGKDAVYIIPSSDAPPPVEGTEEEGLPPLLIQGDLGRKLCPFFFLHVANVALIAQYPEGCHIEPGLKRCAAKGLVIGNIRNMGRHRTHGIAIAVAGLDLRPGHRIAVITGPDLGEIGKDPEIEPVSAGGAALKEDMGKSLRQGLHHPVQSQHIPVGRFPLPLRRKGLTVDIRHGPVHIPFHVGDLRRTEDPGHGGNDMILHLCPGQIQKPLVSSLGMQMPGDIHGPVRMIPVQAAVHIDHLRFHPETELKPQGRDLVRQTLQTVGKLLRIDLPVPQGLCIILPVTEPSVIHNEELDPHLLPSLCKGKELLFIDLEISSLPAVQQDRPRPVLPFSPDDMLPDKPVHGLTHAVEARL